MENTINKSKKQIISIITILFIVLSIIKFIEFIFIRTEEHTVLADNVICKICCIVGTLIAMKYCNLKFSDIGLKYKNTFKEDFIHER